MNQPFNPITQTALRFDILALITKYARTGAYHRARRSCEKGKGRPPDAMHSLNA